MNPLDKDTLLAAAESHEDAHGVLAGQEVRDAIERLWAFAFGNAPEWENANATLKHRVRELETEVAEARRLLDEFGSCDPYTGEPYDEVVKFLGERAVGE